MPEKIENVPKHVAIIPDGNRRWARKKGFRPWSGHQTGAAAFEKILEKSRELKIPYITFWGGSWDNLTKRPKTELKFLYRIYADQFKRIVADERIHRNKVKVNVLGRWPEILPSAVQIAINKAVSSIPNSNPNL